MSKARIWFALSAFLLASVATAAQKAEPEAPAVNLHGKIYMGIIALNNSGIPDPEGLAHLPFYFAFGQEGNKLYGCSVQADQDKLTTPSAQAVNLTLTQWVLKNGVVNGDQFTCDLYDEQGKSLNMGLKGKIQGGGEQIELYVKISILDIGPFYLYRCNENDHYSGIYVGKGDYTTTLAAETPNNVLVGVIVKPDGRMTFAALLYDPSDPGERYTFYGETDDFDPETGTFSYHGNALLGEPDVEGYIGGGVMDLQVTSAYGYKAEATLYFFESEHKRPKLKKPKPIKLPKGKTTSVKIKHLNVLRGTFISDNNPGVQISSFRYSQKYLYLDLDVAPNATGKVKLTLTAPDGNKYIVKKQMKIK
jgi:hypothetical protein